MSDDTKAPQPQSPASRVSDSRRRLVQAGLAGTPLFLALNSTSAFAHGFTCKNPSGFSVSGNLSRRAGESTTCGHFPSPKTWCGTDISQWPQDACQYESNWKKKAKRVCDTLGSNAYFRSSDDTRLDKAMTNYDDFVKYMSAAYLNCKSSSWSGTFPVDADQLLRMWQYGPSGTYKPNASYPSTQWGINEIVTYLTYLMGA